MRCRDHGATRADVVTIFIGVIVVLSGLFGMLLPGYQRERIVAYRHSCGTNLMEMGQAMMVYASDYDGVLPVAGPPGTAWGPGLNDWKADNRAEAFGADVNAVGGQATVGASLYLLVRYAEVSPELFVCRRDKGTRVFRPEEYGLEDSRLDRLWDFGPDPARHCSYAYHLPYGQFGLTTSVQLGAPVAADRNPWIDGPRHKTGEFSRFQPDLTSFGGTTQEALRGNSPVHASDGQNVLYLDGHVEFAKRAYCGVEEDNAYTSWDGLDKARGVPPRPYESQPAHQLDSLLVNDPPLGR